MPASPRLRVPLVLAAATLLATLAGCSGNAQPTPTPTGPVPVQAASGQVFTSSQLDIALTPVGDSTGVTVPDGQGGTIVAVSKTGSPQQVTDGMDTYVPGDGLGFAAVEVSTAPPATPFPTWNAGTVQAPKTSAQFLVDNAPVGQPVNLPVAGQTAVWTVAAPTSSQVVVQITSGAVVQTIDARTGQPMHSIDRGSHGPDLPDSERRADGDLDGGFAHRLGRGQSTGKPVQLRSEQAPNPSRRSPVSPEQSTWSPAGRPRPVPGSKLWMPSGPSTATTAPLCCPTGVTRRASRRSGPSDS